MMLNLENIFLFMSSSERQNNGIIHSKLRKDVRGILEMVIKLCHELCYSRKQVMCFFNNHKLRVSNSLFLH